MKRKAAYDPTSTNQVTFSNAPPLGCAHETPGRLAKDPSAKVIRFTILRSSSIHFLVAQVDRVSSYKLQQRF